MSLGTDFAEELDNYRRKCLELEEKSKKDEMRCLMLEVEVGDLRKKNEELEGQITMIQKIVDDGRKGKGAIVDLTDEENDEHKFLELMIENKVLECEKTKAENELCYCKEKVKQLELRVFELESKATINCKDESPIGTDDVSIMVTPGTHMDKNDHLIDDEKVKEDIDVVSTHKSIGRGESGAKKENRHQVVKQLSFEEDVFPSTKLAPSTPGAARPPIFGASNEDINYSETPKVKKLSDSSNCGDLSNDQCSPKNDIERTIVKHFDEEDTDGSEGHAKIPANYRRKRAPNVITDNDEKSNEDEEDMDGFKGHSSDTIKAKRKRAATIVTSDDDTSDDDNALICTLRTRNSSRLRIDSEDEVNDVRRRRRLTRLRKVESRNKQDKNTFDLNKSICIHEISSSESEEDDDGLEEGSESKGDSMDGFIVESSESDSELGSGSGNSCNESEDASSDFKATLDKIRRKRASNRKWDLEGDMLADFGKDPELCMRAVCALYRQQTMDEKESQGTIYHNERGFSHTDAFRGSKLAEFLTDGDSSGNLNKTVEELKRYDSKGIKLCMKLAAKYSKQLFAIYQNKEDPYFLPR